jgi:alpha-D-xyloside xylohydrolase
MHIKKVKPYIRKWFPYPFAYDIPHLITSEIIDLTNPDVYQWYFDTDKTIFDIGVAVIKPDYGETTPEDTIVDNGESGRKFQYLGAKTQS